MPGFAEAPEQKLTKYRLLPDTLREKGHDVMVQVLIIGAFEAWDPKQSASCKLAEYLPLHEMDEALHCTCYNLAVERHLH